MRRTIRRTAAGLALGAIALAGAGCVQSDSPTAVTETAASAAQGETWVEAWDSVQPPALPTLVELTTALTLTEKQIPVVSAALADWNAAEAAFRERIRDRMHDGRPGDAGFGVPGAAGENEPPLLTFLGTVVPVLEPAQVDELVALLQARMQAGPHDEGMGPHGPMHGPGPGGPGPFLGDALHELDLSADQRDALREQLHESGQAFHDLRVSFAEGTITAEQLRDGAKALREQLETVLAGILSDEQLATLHEAMAEHRAEVATRRLATLEQDIQRRAAFLEKVLQLTPSQASAVSGILEGTVPERTAILTALRDGTMQIEDALYQGYLLAEQTAAAIRAELTPEQAAVFDALKMLIPGHHRGPGGP